MPFARSKKNTGGAPTSPTANTTRNGVLSKEGLFDIAFGNYKQQNPQSGMKRRDFRRNVWESDEIKDYLDEEQYAWYKAYLNGEDVQEEVNASVDSMESPDDGSGHESKSVAIIDQEVGNFSGEENLERLSERVQAAAYENAAVVVSQVEPAYDDHFLDDIPRQFAEAGEDDSGELLVGNQTSMVGMGDLLNVPDEENTSSSVGNDEFEAYAPETDEYEPSWMSEAQEPKVKQEFNMEEENISAPEGKTMADLEEAEPVEEYQDSTEKTESEVVDGEELSDGIVDDELGPAEDHKDLVRSDTVSNEFFTSAQQELDGIFAEDGIMERLRRSMYLDPTDTSMDDEILQFTPREVFEQLIRLEGCVRKVSNICDIAQLVFGSAGSDDSAEPTRERLGEILANAANAISYLMHFPCDPTDRYLWNNEVANHLGLTAEERLMGLVPEQRVNTEFIVRHSEACNESLMDQYYLVDDDYTRICRVLFMYEQAYEQMPIKDLGEFLHLYGICAHLLDPVDAQISEDMVIEKGHVILN